MAAKRKKIEIMDTTLRDGEQTNNLSYSPNEKLHIARILLEKVNVSRIEVASARVSKGEEQSVKLITDWAKKKDKTLLDKIEVLGFIDNTISIDWIKSNGGRVINLLTKGSMNHLKNQLKQTADKHFSLIEKTVKYANQQKVSVNVYLEDWSNGYLSSKDYMYDLIDFLISIKVKRLMLPDTLGILYPIKVAEAFLEITERHPQQHFDFHPQNDYGLGTINCLEAIRSGAGGVHTTVNSLGERAGNAALAEVVTGIHDHLGLRTDVNEKALFSLSQVVETFSGKRIAQNAPIVGEDVFTHTAGIHADGNKKGGLYDTRLLPDRFGRKREYALGKLAGKASLEMNLKELGIELNEENRKKVLARIIELGDKKNTVTTSDLPFIIAEVLKLPSHQAVKIVNATVTSGISVKAMCSLELLYHKNTYKVSGLGDGSYDAFMNAIGQWAKENKIKIPELVDYEIRIPPGGQTSAMVECRIVWAIAEKQQKQKKQIATIGIAHDQVLAAISATEKMLNLVIEK